MEGISKSLKKVLTFILIPNIIKPRKLIRILGIMN